MFQLGLRPQDFNVSYEMCECGKNVFAGLFSVCPLSQSCVSLSPPGIYCAAALESMQECDESCWVAHSVPRLLLKVPISTARETIGPRMAAFR